MTEKDKEVRVLKEGEIAVNKKIHYFNLISEVLLLSVVILELILDLIN